MGIEVGFSVDKILHAKWCGEAEALGLKVSQYIKLRAMGIIRDDQTPARQASVTAEIAETPAPLRELILAAMARAGCSTIKNADVRRLAAALNVSRRQIYASLGSMVGSGRLRHDREFHTYHIVKEEN